jgi:hypothetical protein
MFEITADDIALLKDDDLRAVVGRLCESEMRRRGISASCVTWGGHQDAPDAGIDVFVSMPPGLEGEGFVPRPLTGFQAKAEVIAPGKVESEMRPNGSLRPEIRQLAEKSGAYIIVSSKSSTTHSALNERLHVMEEAVRELPCADRLKLDFYDRRRIGSQAGCPHRSNSNSRITEKELSHTKERRKQNSISNKIAFFTNSALHAFSQPRSALAARCHMASVTDPLSSAPNLAIIDFPVRGHL